MLSNRPDWAPPLPRNSNSRETGSTVSTTALMVVVCSASTDRHAPISDSTPPMSNRARRFIPFFLSVYLGRRYSRHCNMQYATRAAAWAPRAHATSPRLLRKPLAESTGLSRDTRRQVLQQLHGVTGNHSFLICRDNPDGNLRL